MSKTRKNPKHQPAPEPTPEPTQEPTPTHEQRHSLAFGEDKALALHRINACNGSFILISSPEPIPPLTDETRKSPVLLQLLCAMNDTGRDTVTRGYVYEALCEAALHEIRTVLINHQSQTKP